MENEVRCPYCDNAGVLKHGKYKGVQRYFCNQCGSKFKADDTHMTIGVAESLIACGGSY